MIGGEACDEEARTFGKIESFRQRNERACRKHDLLGIAAGALAGDHAITNPPPTNISRHLDDGAGAFDAGDEGERRLVLILAENGERVGKIDASGGDGDTHLARRERGARQVRKDENFPKSAETATAEPDPAPLAEPPPTGEEPPENPKEMAPE